jgi:hypothetical protein
MELVVRSTVSQLAIDACTDVCPESASAGARIVRRQTLSNDFPVQLRHRNLLSSCRDSIPERLHEIDLLVDREIVEPWRRSGDYLGHGENSYDQEYIANRQSKKPDQYAPILAIIGSWNLYPLPARTRIVLWSNQ